MSITLDEFYEARDEYDKLREIKAAELIRKQVRDIHVACREARKTRQDVLVIAFAGGHIEIRAVDPGLETAIEGRFDLTVRFGRKGNGSGRKWRYGTIWRELVNKMPMATEYYTFLTSQMLRKQSYDYANRGGSPIAHMIRRDLTEPVH